jgi:ankyrin repeat protein
LMFSRHGRLLLLSVVSLPLMVLCGRDELYDAVFFANADGVKQLLKGRHEKSSPHIDVNHIERNHGRTALMMCGMADMDKSPGRVGFLDESCRSIGKMLHKAGTNMTQIDFGGWDALHHASVRGFTRFAEYLVTSCGLPVDRGDNDGLTPLMKASGHFFVETAEMLIKKANANVLLLDKKGRTAVHIVVQAAVLNDSFVPFLQKMLDLLPTEVSEPLDQYQRTPLHYSLIGVGSGKGSVAVAKALIEKGADVSLRDGFGVSPYEMTSNAEIKALIALTLADRAERDHKTWLETSEKYDL